MGVLIQDLPREQKGGYRSQDEAEQHHLRAHAPPPRSLLRPAEAKQRDMMRRGNAGSIRAIKAGAAKSRRSFASYSATLIALLWSTLPDNLGNRFNRAGHDDLSHK